ncbi:MAG: hypothetical protein HQM16_17240 [Deltaproteobacteria bacterium]|nr:hypothetical protein [Deltaproteobacteria bacterium]
MVSLPPISETRIVPADDAERPLLTPPADHRLRLDPTLFTSLDGTDFRPSDKLLLERMDQRTLFGLLPQTTTEVSEEQVTNLTFTRPNSSVLHGKHPRSIGFEIPTQELYPTPTVDHQSFGMRLYLDHSIANDFMLLLSLTEGPMLRGAGFMWQPGVEQDFSFEDTMIKESFDAFDELDTNYQTSVAVMGVPLQDLLLVTAEEWEAAGAQIGARLTTLADDLKQFVEKYTFPVLNAFNNRHPREVLSTYDNSNSRLNAFEDYPNYSVDIVKLLQSIYSNDVSAEDRATIEKMIGGALSDIEHLIFKVPIDKFVDMIQTEGFEGVLNNISLNGQSLKRRWDIIGGFFDLLEVKKGDNYYHARGVRSGRGHGDVDLFARYEVDQGGEKYTFDRINAVSADVFGRAHADIHLNFSKGASVLEMAGISAGLGDQLSAESVDELLQLFPGLAVFLLDAKLKATIGYEFLTRVSLSESFIRTWADTDREYSFGIGTLSAQQITESDTITVQAALKTAEGRASFAYEDRQRREALFDSGAFAYGRVAEKVADEWFGQLVLGAATLSRIKKTTTRTYATQAEVSINEDPQITYNNTPQEITFDREFILRPIVNVVVGADGPGQVNPYAVLTTFPNQRFETGAMGGFSFPAAQHDGLHFDLAGKLSVSSTFSMFEAPLLGEMASLASLELGMTFLDPAGLRHMTTHYQDALQTQALAEQGRGTYQLEADHRFYQDLDGVSVKTGVDTDTRAVRGNVEVVYGAGGSFYTGLSYTTDLRGLAEGTGATHIGRLLLGSEAFHIDALAGIHSNSAQHGNIWGFAAGGSFFGGNWTLDLFAEPLQRKDPREALYPVVQDNSSACALDGMGISAGKCKPGDQSIAWEQRLPNREEPEIEAHLTFRVPIDSLTDSIVDFLDDVSEGILRLQKGYKSDPHFDRDVSSIIGG